MITTFLTLLSLSLSNPAPLEALSTAPSTAPSPSYAARQDPDQPPPDNRPEIKELVDKLGSHAGKRGKEDTEAVGVIDKLMQEFENCGPKDRGAIVKQLDKCFGEKRQEDADGVRDDKLYIAATRALGRMAPECVPVLSKWIGDKNHRKNIRLQQALIEELGRSKAESGRTLLIGLLNDENAVIQGAAAQALANYAEIDLKLRKETFESLLKLMTSVKGQVDSDPNDTIARNRYDAIAGSINTTLQRLSKHDEHDPAEWQRWWNKNKKEDWDKK